MAVNAPPGGQPVGPPPMMGASFNRNTRSRFIQLPTQVRPSGGGLSTPALALPKVGLLARLWLSITGSVGGTVGTVNAFGFSSILKRVSLNINAGLSVFDVSGPGYHYGLRETLDSEYGDLFGDTNAKTAITATTFNISMMVPIQINYRDPTGLILLQNEQTQVTLSLNWESDTVVTSTGTFSNVQCVPYMEYFSLPANRGDWPDLTVSHQVLEESQAVSGSGVVTYNWPRGNVYLAMIHGLGWAAAGSDGFSLYQWRINQSDYLLTAGTDLLDRLHRGYRYRARPAGGIYVDEMASSGLGNYGLSRDLFDSSKVTDCASLVTATGSGTLYTIRRQLVPLQPPAPAAPPR